MFGICFGGAHAASLKGIHDTWAHVRPLNYRLAVQSKLAAEMDNPRFVS